METKFKGIDWNEIFTAQGIILEDTAAWEDCRFKLTPDMVPLIRQYLTAYIGVDKGAYNSLSLKIALTLLEHEDDMEVYTVFYQMGGFFWH